MAEKNLVTAEEKQKVEEIISKHPGIFEIMSDRSKVLCLLTKHELALSVKALESYINGKKFQLLLKKVKKPEVVLRIDDRYKEYFVPSRKSTSRLFCTLTKKEINKLPHEIEKYITGYKFMKAVDKAKKLKEEGKELTLHVEEDVEKKEENDNDEEKENEDDVPFFALSEGEEDQEDEDVSGLKGEDDDIIEEDKAGSDADIEMKENAAPEDVDKEDTTEEKIPITNNKENDMHGKKRKNKSKSNKGTKKVKHGAK